MAIIKKDVIQVPNGIRYLGQWTEFNFSIFPDNKFILDKQLPGCGFTEYCTNYEFEDVILCSPRIMLINNKADQHPDDVFLVKNEMDKDPDVDKDLMKQSRSSATTDQSSNDSIKEREEIARKNSEIHEKIKKEFEEYYNRRVYENKPIKVLVTYDSYHIVQDLFAQINYKRFEDSYTIVDEFQSILHDSRFKSSTEMQFLTTLKRTKHVIFASATPTMEKYINMLDEFNGLPLYTLDWGSLEPTRIIKPDLNVTVMRSVTEKACKVVKSYLEGKFESVVVQRDGQPVKITSTEAVLYVNSVNHITSIIKKMGLTPDQVLILCSNTDENQKRIWTKLNKKYNIGHVPNPLKGEKFPMFTFCTRTVYLGADFYSDNARTFIFSDANIDSLAVDISEDLPQILGRQRLIANPWKNSATLFYRSTANYRNLSYSKFQEELDRKLKRTDNLLQAYKDASSNSIKKDLAVSYQTLAKLMNYKDDYVGVNVIYTSEGNKILKPKMNNLVYVNEIRAFDIQQVDYKDRFTVFSAISNKLNPNDIVTREVSYFLRIYEGLTTIYDKLKLLCEFDISDQAKEVVLSQIPDSDEVKSYYTALSPEKLKALSYNSTRIKKELGILTFSPELLINSIYDNFQSGKRMSLVDIKTKLTEIYQKINYEKSPKATDIIDFFDVKECIIVQNLGGGNKKRLRGYDLLTSHEQEMRDKLKAMKN